MNKKQEKGSIIVKNYSSKDSIALEEPIIGKRKQKFLKEMVADSAYEPFKTSKDIQEIIENRDEMLMQKLNLLLADSNKVLETKILGIIAENSNENFGKSVQQALESSREIKDIKNQLGKLSSSISILIRKSESQSFCQDSQHHRSRNHQLESRLYDYERKNKDIEEYVQKQAVENRLLKVRLQDLEKLCFPLRATAQKIQIAPSPEFSSDSLEFKSDIKNHKKSYNYSSKLN